MNKKKTREGLGVEQSKPLTKDKRKEILMTKEQVRGWVLNHQKH